MKKILQFLWENISDQRQFEETHTKTNEGKSATFVGKFFGQKAIRRKIYKNHIKKKLQFL